MRMRCNWVLQRMHDDGFLNEKMLLEALFSLSEPWVHSELTVTPIKDRDFGYAGRFVKEGLLLTNGFTDEAITQTGGYRIRTSIVPYIQKIVSIKLRDHLTMLNSELPPGAEKLNGAAVVLDLKTSKILAFTGGNDYTETPFNRAMSIRSAGSASKLIVYSAYFEETGASYDGLLPNIPFSMVAKVDIRGRVIKHWRPENFPEKKPVPHGMQPIAIVLPRSVNLPAIYAAKRAGMQKIVQKAHSYGIWGTPGVVRDPNGAVVLKVLGADETLKDGIDPYLPTAIAMNANLIELASAFAVTGRRGVYLPPSIIQEVRNAEGRVVYIAQTPKPLQVDDPEICRKMTVLLRAVTKYGTLKISMRGIRQEVGGKTGTSHEANDFNVVILTPDLVLAIRIGYDYPKPVDLPRYMKRSSGDSSLHISAGWVNGPLARDMLDAIYAIRPIVPFPEDTEEDLTTLVARYGNK